jgi:predicted CXXCH cytochrome family protein
MYSELCLNCHQTTYWATSTHKTSTKTWNGTAPDPWTHTPPTFTNVAQNACENCHNPHSAATKPRLMNFTPEENNCLDCHNANVAAKNIQAQFAKTNKHNIYGYTGVHDPLEANWAVTKHVECEDCHNPHATSATTAVAPFVNGFNAGVKGINQSGNPVNPVQFEYEICYRCHSGNTWSPAAVTPRVIVQNNTRLEFAPGNPSFHSVAAVGVNTSVPSLIAPWTITSRIYCSDCHASDGASSPAGPHGSTFPRILKLQYSTANNTTESATAYALCYSCHSRTSIMSDVSFKEHSKHIQGEKTPCNACHDPHGISSSQGNSINNSNLINFWTGIMTPSPGNGAIRFEDQGIRRGRCFLTCHGEDHDGWNYP